MTKSRGGYIKYIPRLLDRGGVSLDLGVEELRVPLGRIG